MISENVTYRVLPQMDPLHPDLLLGFVVERIKTTYLGPFGTMDGAMAAMREDFKERTVEGRPGGKPA